MASILRQIIASPRARHPEAGLDLCYVTDFLIATSGPSSTFPKKAYRNPTDQLVKFLDYKHDIDWAIWEFRAEGTGYPDSEVYGRIHHFPWPDHHPPPFALVPNIMASMRQWLRYEDQDVAGDLRKHHLKKRVVVVHCKAGKGRSGTIACSYLISQEGWTAEDALQRFTDRRMRVGFGAGVSIPSQLRWVSYVDRWTNHLEKKYVERPVEIVEIHVWGLRDGVKVAVEGFVDGGRRIQSFHIFTRNEKTVFDDGKSTSTPFLGQSRSKLGLHDDSSDQIPSTPRVQSPAPFSPSVNSPPPTANSSAHSPSSSSRGAQTVLLRPSSPIILPTSDVNIDFERRNTASYTGFTMVTSVAHVWFNTYFEGGSDGLDSGVFEINWDAMDGIKGSVRKGIQALDRVKILWRYAKSTTYTGASGDDRLGRVITEPAKGEPVEEGKPTDWRGPDSKEEDITTDPDGGLSSGPAGSTALAAGAFIATGAETLGKGLGLRKDEPASADISRANSLRSKISNNTDLATEQPYPDADEGVPSSIGDIRTQTTSHDSTLPKSPDLISAEQEAEEEEAAAITPLAEEQGRDRGHEPVPVHGPEGPEVISYEDGESDEEAVAPSNSAKNELRVKRERDEAGSGAEEDKGIVEKMKHAVLGDTEGDRAVAKE